ncbi:MAG: hypothetical protein QM702_21195 [Rubrivivax sp.]
MALLACASAAEAAAPRKKVGDLCEGCLATVPEGTEPVPLLVTLHGDWGHMAPDLHRAWERFAAPRDVALLSLACPAKLGCKDSWWRWNGDPSWIVAQVDRLAAARPIDRDRMWIAGWSGGASYIGMRTQEIERTFAGIVIHGGGIWPSPSDCPTTKARVVFLVGDKNPLHDYALALRDHYARCGNDLVMHLLKGAEHDAEWKALSEKGDAVMTSLVTARMAPPAAAAVVTSSSPPATAPAPVAVQNAPVPAELPVRPRAGCSCEAGARDERALAAIVVVLLAAVRRRRQPCAIRTERARSR